MSSRQSKHYPKEAAPAWEQDQPEEFVKWVGADWWKIELGSASKGTLIHAAARQGKINLLKSVIASQEDYKNRWPHRGIQKGLLESWAIANPYRVQEIQEWYNQGIRFGLPDAPSTNFLNSVLFHKNSPSGIRLLRHQWESYLVFSKKNNIDFWSVDQENQKDPRELLIQFTSKSALTHVLETIPNPQTLPLESIEKITRTFSSEAAEKAFEAIKVKERFSRTEQLHIVYWAFESNPDLALRLAEKEYPIPALDLNECICKITIPKLKKESMFKPILDQKENLKERHSINPMTWVEPAIQANRRSLAFKILTQPDSDLDLKDASGRYLALPRKTDDKEVVGWIGIFKQCGIKWVNLRKYHERLLEKSIGKLSDHHMAARDFIKARLTSGFTSFKDIEVWLSDFIACGLPSDYNQHWPQEFGGGSWKALIEERIEKISDGQTRQNLTQEFENYFLKKSIELSHKSNPKKSISLKKTTVL